MVEEVAFTKVIPRPDGEYGVFLRDSRAWEMKLTAELAETIREGLPTALGGEVHVQVDPTGARPVAADEPRTGERASGEEAVETRLAREAEATPSRMTRLKTDRL